MTSPKPLFGTALARSGGGLLTHVVSANPRLMMARHPYLELFREWRDAVGVAAGASHFGELLGAEAPFADYYFDRRGAALLDEIVTTDADLELPDRDRAGVLDRIRARAELESPDIAEHVDRLADASTVKDLFDFALEIVVSTRNAGDRDWVGFQDPWVIDFFPALARAYPTARFIVLMRDIRAVVNSMLANAERYPEQAAPVISYVRHWRKYAAFLIEMRRHMEDRLHVVRYEDLVQNPEMASREICSFLDTPFDQAMTGADGFTDPSTGRTWEGNSSFVASARIDATAVDRWRDTLPSSLIVAIEVLCEPEMRAFGYFLGDAEEPERDRAMVENFLTEPPSEVSWRSGLGDPLLDLGAEKLRRLLLTIDTDAVTNDVIKRCFLFDSAFRELRRMMVDTREESWKAALTRDG